MKLFLSISASIVCAAVWLAAAGPSWAQAPPRRLPPVEELPAVPAAQPATSEADIDTEDLPHVFKRFYRGSPTGADGSLLDPRGLGQGLYVVKSVVEAHEGRVWVESEVGSGSEFSILLPLSPKNT